MWNSYSIFLFHREPPPPPSDNNISDKNFFIAQQKLHNTLFGGGIHLIVVENVLISFSRTSTLLLILLPTVSTPTATLPKNPCKWVSTLAGVYFKYSFICFLENLTGEYELKNDPYIGRMVWINCAVNSSRKTADDKRHSPCCDSNASKPVLKTWSKNFIIVAQHIKN